MRIRVYNENAQSINIKDPPEQTVGVGFNMGAHVARVNEHIADEHNPHNVTAEQTGAIEESQKGAAGGVATLNESGIVPEQQLPTIPTSTAQLKNDSGYVTEKEVDAKLEEFSHISSGTIEALKGLETALDEHEDEYDALLQQVGEKANTEDVEDEFKTKGQHFIGKNALRAVTGASNLSMRWITNDVDGITEPFPGMMISVQIPMVMNSGVTNVLSIDGGQTFHPVLRNKASTLLSTYAEGNIIVLIYNDLISREVYLEAGVKQTIKGSWQISDYDSDKMVQQSQTTLKDQNVPVLFGSGYPSTGTATTGITYYSKDLWFNPLTGEFNAKKLLQNGKAIGGSGGSSGSASLTIPIIRVVTVADVDRTGVIGPNNPLRVTIATEGGLLLPDDEIQLCSRKAMTYKVPDEREDATRQRGRRWRFRKITGRSAEECHPDKSMEEGIYRMICWDFGNDIASRAFLRSDNHYSSGRVVTKYVRVTRMLDEGNYLHSNAVPIQFTVADIEKPGKTKAKINVR